MWQKISKKLDLERMTGRTIYIAYPGGQVTKLKLYYGWSAILATSLLQIIWHSIQAEADPVLKNIYLSNLADF